jgi:hypothetical protein
LYGNAVFARRIDGIGKRVVDLNGSSERPKLANDVDDLGIADVDYILFEGQSQHGDSDAPARLQQTPQALACHQHADRIVDAPAGKKSG